MGMKTGLSCGKPPGHRWIPLLKADSLINCPVMWDFYSLFIVRLPKMFLGCHCAHMMLMRANEHCASTNHCDHIIIPVDIPASCIARVAAVLVLTRQGKRCRFYQPLVHIWLSHWQIICKLVSYNTKMLSYPYVIYRDMCQFCTHTHTHTQTHARARARAHAHAHTHT